MSDEIQPALSRGEWRMRIEFPGRGCPIWGVHLPDYDAHTKHGIAALMLHGQPFGFTHIDVALLESSIEYAQDPSMPQPQAERDWLKGLAKRIAALLPPPQRIEE